MTELSIIVSIKTVALWPFTEKVGQYLFYIVTDSFFIINIFSICLRRRVENLTKSILATFGRNCISS